MIIRINAISDKTVEINNGPIVNKPSIAPTTTKPHPFFLKHKKPANNTNIESAITIHPQ